MKMIKNIKNQVKNKDKKNNLIKNRNKIMKIKKIKRLLRKTYLEYSMKDFHYSIIFRRK